MKKNGNNENKTSSKSIVKTSGFTLIELLIVMVVIGVLAVSSMAVLNKFNRTQSLGIKYEDMKNDFYLAKSSALSQVIKTCKSDISDPPPRKVFRGYLLRYTSSSYTIEEVCSIGANNIIKSVDLSPAGITLTSTGAVPGSILFKPLDGGTDIGAAQIDFTLNGSSGTKTIRVYKSGVIEGRTD